MLLLSVCHQMYIPELEPTSTVALAVLSIKDIVEIIPETWGK